MANRLMIMLGAAGLTTTIGLAATDDASAVSKFEGLAPEALETLLQADPGNPHAGIAFQQLAARFKDRDDHGRPDIFGPPGKPAIGAPGQYAG